MKNEQEKEAPKKSKAEREEEKILKKIDAIRELRGEDPEEVTAYVYRQAWGDGGNVSLPQLDCILEDQDLGTIYGAGKYLVVYCYTGSDGETKKKQVRYNIGPEFNDVHRAYCKANGRRCYIMDDTIIPGLPAPTMSGGFQLGDLLHKEKLEGLLMLVTALKSFLGSGSQDKLFELQAKLIQNMAQAPQRSQLEETIVKAAVQKLVNPESSQRRESSPLQSVREQLSLFNELKDTFMPESGPVASEGGTMSKVVEMVLPMLPAILEKFNGNIEAAAAAQMKNPIVKSYLKDTKTQKELFQEIARRDGLEAANRWAAGFGIDPAKFSAQAAPKGGALVGEVVL